MVAVLVTVVLHWVQFARGLGTFRCFVRLPGSAGAFARWRCGAARIDTGTLRWYPLYTVIAARALVLQRSSLELSDRRPPVGADGLPAELTVLLGTVAGRTVELAVPRAAAAALVLWVESGPPGRGVDVV